MHTGRALKEVGYVTLAVEVGIIVSVNYRLRNANE